MSASACIILGGTKVGPNEPPLIVAELSGNHNRSLDRALALVDAAAEAGAHAVKLQTYTPDTMTLNLDTGYFRIDDPTSLWNGRTLYDIYAEAYTPWEWHDDIFERCRRRGMIPFSTPFDATAVDFLETLDAPCYKIASFEVTDLPLIRKVAATGKPLIMSTGMATAEEVADSVAAFRDAGGNDLILLKCTSAYPAPAEKANLRTMADMRERFGVQVGLSDHTLGLGVPLAAVALGAVLIEKHFTLDRNDGGIDSAFSMEPSELKELVEQSGRAWSALGGVTYVRSEQETASSLYRRSLFAVEDIRAGEKFTPDNVRAIRPGAGLSPKHYDEIIGGEAKCDISKGTPLSWDVVVVRGSDR